MSESFQEKIVTRIPWVLGPKIRAPRVKYPVYREGAMSLPSPGRSMTLILLFIVLFWLVMGGIYIQIRDPIPMGSTGTGESATAVWLYPSTHEAFIIESIVAAALIYLAGAGFHILYTVTKHAFNYAYAVKLLVIGFLFVGIGFGLLQYMIAVKTGQV